MIFLQTPEPISDHSYGRSICVVADENGDAVPDFAIADGLSGRGEISVDLRSGKSQRRLWRATIKSFDVDCVTLVPIGDMNLDGRAEVALAAWNVGVVHVFSGADGKSLHTFASPAQDTDARFYGASLCAADFDLDGKADVALAGLESCSTVCSAHVYIRSGLDGSTLHDVVLGQVRVAELETGFDFDADRTPDLAVLVTDWSKADATDPVRTVVIVSGKTGKQLEVYPWRASSAPHTQFIRKPNLPRLLCFQQNRRDGKECSQIVRFGPDEIGNALQRVPIEDCVSHQSVLCIAPDLNGDGVEDIIRGAHEAGSFFQGEVTAYSGKDWKRLWKIDGDSDLGAAVASGIDFDDDQVPDVLAGAVWLRGEEHSGSVWAISGRTGKQLWTLDSSSP